MIPRDSDWAPRFGLSHRQSVLQMEARVTFQNAYATPLPQPLLGLPDAPDSGSQPEVCTVVFSAALYIPVPSLCSSTA